MLPKLKRHPKSGKIYVRPQIPPDVRAACGGRVERWINLVLGTRKWPTIWLRRSSSKLKRRSPARRVMPNRSRGEIGRRAATKLTGSGSSQTLSRTDDTPARIHSTMARSLPTRGRQHLLRSQLDGSSRRLPRRSRSAKSRREMISPPTRSTHPASLSRSCWIGFSPRFREIVARARRSR